MTSKLIASTARLVAWLLIIAAARPALAEARFDVSFAESVDPGPITGRVLVIIAKGEIGEPRLRASSFAGSTSFFGVDVGGLKPGESVTIDESTIGYPLRSLRELPAGDYSVQAVLNVY